MLAVYQTGRLRPEISGEKHGTRFDSGSFLTFLISGGSQGCGDIKARRF